MPGPEHHLPACGAFNSEEGVALGHQPQLWDRHHVLCHLSPGPFAMSWQGPFVPRTSGLGCHDRMPTELCSDWSVHPTHLSGPALPTGP